MVIRKIGVLRANALGDLIVSLPALAALKESYPNAELVLLGRRSHFELFNGRKPVDRVIVLPPSIQFDRPIELNEENQKIVDAIKEEKFDVLVQLHGGGRYSNAFVNMLRPLISVGAKTSDAPPLSRYRPYTQFQHEVLRELEVVELLGAKGSSFTPRISLPDDEKNEGRNVLHHILGNNKGRIVLLNPGATDPRRRWPAEKFGDVAKRLALKDTVLVNSGPGEEKISEAIKSICPEVKIIQPSLRELLALLSNCDLVISNDTGTMHLSMAIEVPTVALFWHRNVMNYAPVKSENTRLLVSWQSQCSTCGANCCKEMCEHEDSLLNELSVQEVLKASEELLERVGGSNHLAEDHRGRVWLKPSK
ncbi:glycosyltransferase family 9 protein [Peredibacter sp. HCB2-198]|uniref:glycosyltransferase family 9 protein n=1 Tax=Peredibacter sp. HCB2-198 TaxID=3383025 RepID=UPI0038B46660